jgi:hypothetical protein
VSCSAWRLGRRASRCLELCRTCAISSHLVIISRDIWMLKELLPSVMLPKAAFMPPCAATVCDRVGN